MESGKYSNSPQIGSNDFNIKELIGKYLKYWYWFLISVLLCGAGAYLYLRYATPQYSASAKIMLADEKGNIPTELAVFEELDLMGSNVNKVEDEIHVLKSRSLMTNVAKRLDLNVRYYAQGRVKEVEVFQDAPITITFITPDSILESSKFELFFTILSENTFSLKEEEGGVSKNHAFGETVKTSSAEFIVTPGRKWIDGNSGQEIKVKVEPLSVVAEYYRGEIYISPSDEGSSVLNIYLNDPVQKKAEKVINTLIDEYNKNSIEEKNLVAKNTADFINERIDLISKDLSDVDQTAAQFKTSQGLTDIASEANIYLNTGSQNEQQLIAASTELNLVNAMKSRVRGDGFDIVPANIGLTDPSINTITAQYNELVIQRNRLLESSGNQNPIIVNLDQQLSSLKQNLQQSLNNLSNTLNIRVNNLRRQSDIINSRIAAVPGQEKQFTDITRQQGIKAALYTYLLQKREETAISQAAASPNAKIIDWADSIFKTPVSPKPKIVYLASFLLGLLIPFAFIYIKDLLDTKIHNKEDLEKHIKEIPVLAEIPRITNRKELLVERNDRSVLAESFRILRTNLDYFIRTKGREKNNIIYVTSTINGEGKTFVSFNFALTLANADKKVLIIGADIRSPKLHLFLKKPLKGNGLTEYLYDFTLEPEDVIRTTQVNGNSIDILLSGKIPPNPAELLMSDRMEALLKKVSDDYDYVVVDTAPSMLVTDTLLISQFAHHTIYVTRADYTEKRLLNFPQEIYNDKKLKGMVMLVNDVKASNFGYGGKYGYGYVGKENKVKKKRFF